MKYKIKVRVTSPDLKQNKYSLNIQDTENLVLNKDTPGLSLRHESVEGYSCFLYIKDGGLAVKGPNSETTIVLNQIEKLDSTLKVGDVLSFGGYSIEFLDIPVAATVEKAADGHTQFIDLSSGNTAPTQPKQEPYVAPKFADGGKKASPLEPVIQFFKKYPKQFAIGGAAAVVALGVGIFSYKSIQTAKFEAIQAKIQAEKALAHQAELDRKAQAQKDYMIQLQQELDLARTAAQRKAQAPKAEPVAKIKPADIEKFVSAAGQGDIDIVKNFIKKKRGEASARNKAGTPALVAAAKGGELEIAKFLVAHDAEINARDKKGMTALMWAASKKNTKLVSYLLSQKADAKLKNKEGKKAIDIASKAKAANIVALLKKGSGSGTREIASVKSKSKSKTQLKSKSKSKTVSGSKKSKKKSRHSDDE